jgi:uncharacterized membrane protein HdeD (DUF308 family)
MDAAVASKSPNWLFILEGIALLLFGIAAIAWPGMTFYTFTVLFGLYALVAGVANVVGGILNIRKGWSAIGGIALGALLIAAGSYVMNHPGITALSLVLFIAFTFIVRGIFEIVMAISENPPHKALAIVSGIFGILVGLILLRYPVGGGLAYIWVLGIYALVSGPIMLAIGLGAGGSHSRHEQY